jgi:hypothetical protein
MEVWEESVFGPITFKLPHLLTYKLGYIPASVFSIVFQGHGHAGA